MALYKVTMAGISGGRSKLDFLHPVKKVYLHNMLLNTPLTGNCKMYMRVLNLAN